MKRRKLNMAQYGMLAPNVQRGGQAIPIGDNLYLMKGRQHSAGGIDIGKDLEVENNEVMQMLPNETRVFSSMPMLGGYSPAQLVANGNNPDLVFNAQERWKKENRVRDDGSTYKEGGIHINPANKGKFTAQAKQHGMGVQSFANKVLAHKENYSPTTVKRATFAKYIGGRKKAVAGTKENINESNEPNINLPQITVYQPLQKTPPNFLEEAIYNVGARMFNIADVYPGVAEKSKEELKNDIEFYEKYGMYRNDPLYISMLKKILEGEDTFAFDAFKQLVPRSKILNERDRLEHNWRMENDRAYRDKINNAGETFDNHYDRISNLPIAEGNDLYNALSWQYDQNNLENQELEKNKADRLAYNQHKGLTESFALPFYIAGALPGLTALPGALGPFLAAHDAEAILAGVLGGFTGLGGLLYGSNKYDEYVNYMNTINNIDSYINTPWVKNALEQARRDPNKAAAIMSQLRYDWNFDKDFKYSNKDSLPFIEGDYSLFLEKNGSVQDAFLLDRDVQKKFLLSRGYTETPGDYGLVKEAVGDRDIPVFQRNPDAISRDKLTPIGNLFNYDREGSGNDGWLSYEQGLEQAGNYPTAIYTDNNGNFYQKAWDLNDYTGRRLGPQGIGLDIVGNPIVVTTGFQRVDPKRILELENNRGFEPTDNWEEVLNKLKQHKQYGGKTRNMNLQNIYNNSLAKFGKRINGSIVRMDGSGIDKLAYIPFTGNRLKTLKAGGRRIAEKGIRYPVRTRNNSTIDDVYIPVRTRKNSATNIDDILEERMKYVEPYFKGQSDIPGYINAGVNALGSIATSLIANNAINKQRPPVKPMPLIAPKLKTNFNINADLDANREATRAAIYDIKKNTASSQVGRNLINQQLFAKALADSKLYTDKENKETELINADITQRAGIVNENIKMGNTYRQALADFYSNKALAKGQNWAQMVNGLGQAIGMGLNNIGATNTKKLNALIAMLPAIETFMKNKKV